MLRTIIFASFLSVSAGQAMASSEDAWEVFSAEVEKGCIEASDDLFTEASAVVDPFGSESYGLAVVTGQLQSGQTASAICVFDKQTKAVELGGELDVMLTSR